MLIETRPLFAFASPRLDWLLMELENGLEDLHALETVPVRPFGRLAHVGGHIGDHYDTWVAWDDRASSRKGKGIGRSHGDQTGFGVKADVRMVGTRAIEARVPVDQVRQVLSQPVPVSPIHPSLGLGDVRGTGGTGQGILNAAVGSLDRQHVACPWPRDVVDRR